MALFQDFIDITIDGADVSDYVVSYTRNESICEPGATFSLIMTRKKPDGSMLDISTSEVIDIKEKYPSEDRVLKGYVTNVEVNANDINMRVSGADKYILLHDYFIHQRFETNGEDVAYWISLICGLVGLDVQFDTYPGILTQVQQDGGGGTPLGMQRASESLQLLERKGAVYTRYDSDLDKIVVYTLDTSQPKVNITSSNVTGFDRTESTESTRNVVKVWGGHFYDWLDGIEHQFLAVVRKIMDELVVDQTMYVANPEIRSQTFANIIANRILTVTGTLDDLVIAECAGLYPDVQIADFASISFSLGDIGQNADRQITSLGVSVDDAGALTTFIFGEKCPRVTFSPPPFFVYSTSLSGGAGVSYDAGNTFHDFNEGLPASGSTYDTMSIAANTYNQLMMITTSGLEVYRRSGIFGTWNKVTVTDPSNDEGEVFFTANDITFIKVEKELGNWDKFHLLANATASGSGGILPSGQQRWWIYWTGDFGYNWESMQLYVPGSGINGIGAASGLPEALINGIGITPADVLTAAAISGAVNWNVEANDVETDKLGNVTLMVTGDPTEFIPPTTLGTETFHAGFATLAGATSRLRAGAWYMSEYDGGNLADANRLHVSTVVTETNGSDQVRLLRGPNAIFSVPNNREVAYMTAFLHTSKEWRVIRTIGNYLDISGETDIPEWEEVDTGGDGAGINAPSNDNLYTLLDHYSLSGNNIVKWCVAYSWIDTNSAGGDDYPTNTTLNVKLIFFEDDITADPSVSLTITEHDIVIGAKAADWPSSPLTYTAEDLYGWIEIHASTDAPVPRQWQATVPTYAGASYSAVTSNKTIDNNVGYYAIMLKDTGFWHGDSRDAGWPGVQHPRDIEEAYNVGIYVIEIDFSDLDDINVECRNFDFINQHSPLIAASQPDRDDDIVDYVTSPNPDFDVNMINPSLIWAQDRWDDHGGHHHYWIDYASFLTLKKEGSPEVTPEEARRYGVRKVPFFAGTMDAEFHTPRGNTGIQWTQETKFKTRVGASFGNAAPPPTTPSGQVIFARQHPDVGVCVTEQRAMAFGRGSPYDDDLTVYDYHFMHKAERVSTTIFVVQGNDVLTDTPYTDSPPPIGIARMQGAIPLNYYWDWRTLSGSTGTAAGGSSANWNFVG